MNILNLVRPEVSTIAYKIIKRSDGQQDVLLDENHIATPVTIFSRMQGFQSLELIMSAVSSLRRMKVKEIHLYIPYLLGARADRKFTKSGAFYLRDVIAPILNSLNFESVQVLDVHSDVSDACINKLLVDEKHDWKLDCMCMSSTGNFVLVCPDDGARKRIYNFADYLKYDGEIIFCHKHRSTKDNSLSDISVDGICEIKDKNLYVIDDICDGGRTFTGIADQIRPWMKGGTLNLIVTHGIFSHGIEDLLSKYDNIYVTNSYSDFTSTEWKTGLISPKFHQTKVI